MWRPDDGLGPHPHWTSSRPTEFVTVRSPRRSAEQRTTHELDRTTGARHGSNTVTYTYSSAGRLSSLTDWGSRTTSYTYSPAGLALTATLPNGLVTTYTYDRAQRLTNLTNVVGSTTITSHSYTLDAEGNRTAQSEFVSGITTGASDSFGYSYDGLNRLIAVTTTNAESFTLDGASNIASRTGPSATYSYDTSNRLTSDGSATFTWSDADRLTGRGSDSFGYDPLDRLTSSTVSGTARTYAYDGDGLLASRTQGGSTTNLLWDPATAPSRLLQVGSDKIVYGLGPLYVVTGSGTTTFARDGGKSVRAEINGSGAVSASFRYLAYGAIAQSSGASTPSYLGYAGQPSDPSGLYYMRARWYDPTSTRFVSRDQLDGLGNVYAYAAGNPVSLFDPSGFAATTVEGSGGCTEPMCEDYVPYNAITVEQAANEGLGQTTDSLDATTAVGGAVLVAGAIDVADLSTWRGVSPSVIQDALDNASRRELDQLVRNVIASGGVPKDIGEGRTNIPVPGTKGSDRLLIERGESVDAPNPVKRGPYLRISFRGEVYRVRIPFERGSGRFLGGFWGGGGGRGLDK